jgi:hypothetical protein
MGRHLTLRLHVMSPKRQHFIPRLQLKHFVGTEPRGQVWTYDSQTGEVRSATPENTALEGHFYSVEAPDGTMDTRIEDYLASVEDRAAPVSEELLRGEIPTACQKRMDFARFLALMYFRTPAMRRMSAEMVSRSLQIMCYAYAINDRAFEALTRRFEKDGGRVLNAEEKQRLREDFIDPSGYNIKVAKEATLDVLAGADKLAPIIFNMKWSIGIPVHGFFITTDNPLVMEVDQKTHHPIYGDHGFLNGTAQVIFPLSPRRLLFMSWNKNASNMGAFERSHVERTNLGMAAQSDRYLYAHVRHKWLKELAAEFKNYRPEFTTYGFGPRNFAKTQVLRRRRTSSGRGFP